MVTLDPIDGDAFEEEPPASLGGPDPSETPKKRRGRPPGSTNKTTGTGSGTRGKPRLNAQDKRNVEAALASMGTLYSLASMGTLALQRPQTAGLIAARTEQWQAGNKEAFEASPALAARIAAAGQVSGTMIFMLTNLMAAGTVFLALREETALIALKREEDRRKAEQENNGF